MDDQDERAAELDEALTELYRDIPDGFVGRRDALVKELRQEGRKDEAAAVKKLRKPGRMAWAVDTVFFAERALVERVVAAVAGMVDAQSGRGDLRDATRALRDAVQDAADVAARNAADAGVNVERASVVPAVMAVVADAESLTRWRRGQLADIPKGGSLDALTAPPTLDVPRLEAVPAPSPEPTDPAAVERARRALDEAESRAADTRDGATRADEEVAAAVTAVEEAEQALRRAEETLRAERQRLRDLRRTAKAAHDKARDAERKLAQARGRLDRLTDAN